MKIAWEKITPKKAADYLKKNTINRSLREETVKAYEADMRRGKWVRTHQGIAFNDRGNLIDGQHRLSAIVRSGATIEILVTRGIPALIGKEHTMDAVDRGVARTIGDQLRLQHGFTNPNFAVAIVLAIARLCVRTRIHKQTTAQALGALEIYGRHIGEIGKLIDTPRQRHFRRPPFAAAIVFARAVEPVAVDRFLSSALSGANLGPTDAALTLRNFILSEQASTMHVMGTKNERFELSCVVLNAIQAALTNAPWPKVIGGRSGFIAFAEPQKKNIAKMAEIYLGEQASLEPDKPGKAPKSYAPRPVAPAVITAANFQLTPAAEELLRGSEMSARATRRAATR